MLLEKAKKSQGQFPEESDDEINMKRYGIVRVQKAGESGGVDIEVVREWKEGKLVEILKSYSLKDIDNADETGLF